MTHPPATCELCGGTGLYSPSALPCPKGCPEFDIIQEANDVLLALSDWAVTYAPDMCDDDMVKKAKARVLQQGTLAYIANVTDKLRNVITALSEAEQREKDARAEAILEAAKTAVLTANHLTILPPSVRKFPEVGGIIAAKILELIEPSIDTTTSVHKPPVDSGESGGQ